MVKHRQLVRQVGAFDEFFLESSADLNLKMTFSAGTTFVFGSWICKADGDGKLRTRLREEKEFDDEVQYKLAEKMTKLSTSNTTRNKEENGYETDSEKEIQPDSKTIFTAQEPSLMDSETQQRSRRDTTRTTQRRTWELTDCATRHQSINTLPKTR